MLSTIFNVLAHFAVGFVIGLIIVWVVSAIWNRYKHRLNKKRVLQAVTELGIEEDLANCVAGCNLSCTFAIEKYFIQHRWGKPFFTSLGGSKLSCILNELRTEGKLKPVYDNLMTIKKKSDGHKNAVLLRNAKNDVV